MVAVVAKVVKLKSVVVRQRLVDERSCHDGCRDDRLYDGNAMVHLVEVRVGGGDGLVDHQRVGVVVVIQGQEPGGHHSQDGGENSLWKRMLCKKWNKYRKEHNNNEYISVFIDNNKS